MIDPQQLNLYSYTRNNPLALVDDDGRQTTRAQPKKPVVTIHKPTINKTTYEVKGATAEEAISNSNKHDGFAGYTKFELGVSWRVHSRWRQQRDGSVTATATITSVDVKTTITVDTPIWVDSAAAPEAEQVAWNQFSTALDAHEEGHVRIDIAGAQDVGNAVAETPPSRATGRTPAAAMKNAEAELNAEAAKRQTAAMNEVREQNKKYDEETDYGRKKPQPQE